MKILITYGGTRVPIDNVRSITNFSNGGTGAMIARDFFNQNSTVHVLKAKDANSALCHKEFVFETYDDYRTKTEELIKGEDYDMIILAAAVSDYTVDKAEGKISSSSETIQLTLRKTEKIISKVREWAPEAMLVGFKLTSGATPGTLLSAMELSLTDNKCDVIIGNDINDLRGGKDTVFFMDHPDNTLIIKREEIAQYILDLSMPWR